MFVANKKKNSICILFLLTLFLGIIFFTESTVAHAENNPCPWEKIGIGSNGDCGFWTRNVADTAALWVKEILYGVFVIEGYLTSVAVTIFEWAAHPDHISGKTGVLNRPAIYEMWQFIRDFFNLFFILVLLYIAFTVVFQIQKNFKQMILSLIIAALLVNFSFPISRFIIDATNVPMYFFANQMMGVTQTKTTGRALGTTLSATKLMDILLPKDKNTNKVNLTTTSLSSLLMAIIFLFMFSITLLVLGVMFVIRLIALMLLVVFSSAGFAASIIPGMDKYSKMWWDNFWKYALFGPAAMFMLLIAVKFFVEISNEKGAIYMAMKKSTEINSAGDPTYLASLAMFSAPIILLWFAIGLGQTMALAGGATISGYGHKFAAWAGKKASGYSAIKRNFDSYVATRKKRTDEKNKGSWGGSLGKTLNKEQDAFYGAMGSKAAEQRVQDMRNKEIYEKAEENKKAGVSDSQLRLELAGRDKIKAAAAAISLSERKAINTTTEFADALKALGNNTKEIGGLIDNASGDAMKISGKDYGEMVGGGSIIGGNERLKSQLDTRLKKAGNAKTLIDYQTEIQKIDTKTAVEDTLKNIKSAKDVANSESVFKDERYRDYAVGVVAARGLDHVQEVKKASAQEGTSVGGYFGATKSKEEVKKEKEEKKRDEDEKASSMMGSLKGSDYKYPSNS